MTGCFSLMCLWKVPVVNSLFLQSARVDQPHCLLNTHKLFVNIYIRSYVYNNNNDNNNNNTYNSNNNSNNNTNDYIYIYKIIYVYIHIVVHDDVFPAATGWGYS